MKRPVLWALGFLICGILIGVYGGAWLILAAFFLCVFLYKVYRYWLVILFAGFLLLGMWRVEESLHSHTIESVETEFSGVVIDVGYTVGGNQRAVVRGIHPVTGGRVRVMAYIQPFQVHVELGQRVVLSGELLPLRRAENPGGYDQFRHLRALKIDATMWPNLIHSGEIRKTPVVLLRQFRDNLAAVYDELLPAREAAVIKSMLLGDRLDMDRDLVDLYRIMGIFHILSISGLHVTILMLAGNKLLSAIINERHAGVIVLVFMILYCLLTGASVATVRAVSMGGVLVGAKIFYREYDLLASVAWVCVALLIFEPLYLFTVGFQLSFGAVFGIGILTAPIERCLSKIKPMKRLKNIGLLKAFNKSLAVGIAAVVSTYIVFAFHFYEIPLYSVLGNIVIAPTVTIILVLGLMVGLVGLVFMPAALLLSGAVYFILWFYEVSAVFFSELPFAMLPVSGGSVVISALGVLVLCMFAYMMHGFGKSFRRRAGLFAISVFALIIVVFLHENPTRLQVTLLYTHGNYIVLRRGGDTVIIGAPHGGEDALLRYLDKRNVRRAAFLPTYPPHPQDINRLSRLMPRIHTLYLPAHASGTTLSLMNTALADLADLDTPEIVFLGDGDKRIASGVIIQAYALPMGRMDFIVNTPGEQSVATSLFRR